LRVAITGASGLVGSALAGSLLARGDEVTALSRDPERTRSRLPEGARSERMARGAPEALARVISGHDAVVNLAGEPVIGRRWNDAVRRELRDSRIEGTNTVVAAMAAAASPPRILVNASAVGYYGHREEPEITEEEGPGTDFLAELSVAWEAAARRAAEAGARVVVLRIGIVLSAEGGALARLLPPFRFFVGGPIGNGRQGFPFIHIDDLVGLLLHALDHEEISGPMNATAPHPVSNAAFGQALGRVLGRPSWLPVPRLALRLVIGAAAAVLAAGQRAVPRRALDTGYEFRFPDVDSALHDLLA
jgi:uncharacterized protein (TIGR01777 family)